MLLSRTFSAGRPGQAGMKDNYVAVGRWSWIPGAQHHRLGHEYGLRLRVPECNFDYRMTR
jgi:hypothetical protein